MNKLFKRIVVLLLGIGALQSLSGCVVWDEDHWHRGEWHQDWRGGGHDWHGGRHW